MALVKLQEILVTGLLLGFLLPASVRSQELCKFHYEEGVRTAETTAQEFRLQKIRNNRSREYELRHGDVVTIQNVNYIIEGILGESSATAYLAKDPSGTFFVVKDNVDYAMYIYETRLTQFLLLNGFDVPKVVGGNGQSQLVKEYFSGITYDEFVNIFARNQNQKFGWAPADRAPLERAVDALHDNFQKITIGQFAQWLQENYPHDYHVATRTESDLINYGDRSVGNYLYSLSEKRWRKFDP